MTAVAEIIVLTAANAAAVLADAQDGERFAIQTPNGLVTMRLQSTDSEPYLGENGEVVAEFGKFLTIAEESDVKEYLNETDVVDTAPTNKLEWEEAVLLEAALKIAAFNYPFKHLRYLLGEGPMDRYQGPCGSSRGDVVFTPAKIAEVLASGRYEIR